MYADAPIHADQNTYGLLLAVFGITSLPRQVSVNQVPVSDWKFDSVAKTLTLTVPASRTATEIVIGK